MSEPEEIKNNPELENKLSRFYQGEAPDPAFASHLETRLVAEAAMVQPAATSRPRDLLSRLLRRPVLVGAMALLLALVIAVAIIGPQKVLAEMQRLFGYLPGYGFVQTEKVHVLVAPVEIHKEGVVLRVESIVAESLLTTVTFTVTGLPQDLVNAEDKYWSSPILVLPDGRQWISNQGEVKKSGNGEMGASFQYPPLPQEVGQVTLLITRLPDLPAGYAPENWSIPLTLAEGKSIPPYTPQNANASDQGVTVSVLQVAQSARELGVQVQFTWQNPAWKDLQATMGILKDENGQELTWPYSLENSFSYHPSPTSAPGLFIRTYQFALPAQPVEKFTFNFNQLFFDVVANASFTFDPGPNPQPGQKWDLTNAPGFHLDIAGIPVDILSAQYEGKEQSYGIQAPESKMVTPVYGFYLTFEIEPRPVEGISIATLGSSEGSFGSHSEGTPGGKFWMSVELPEPPHGPINLKINKASLIVNGSWPIEWVPPQP